jgi:broad specificity phosphatase PhoE
MCVYLDASVSDGEMYAEIMTRLSRAVSEVVKRPHERHGAPLSLRTFASHLASITFTIATTQLRA